MARNDKSAQLRKMVHDLRANHHAANLNAQAAAMLCKKIHAADAEKLAKHLDFLIADLHKFKVNLDEFSALIKSFD